MSTLPPQAAIVLLNKWTSEEKELRGYRSYPAVTSELNDFCRLKLFSVRSLDVESVLPSSGVG
jgi:hypothetical protein